jgi:hypothetical protein
MLSETSRQALQAIRDSGYVGEHQLKVLTLMYERTGDNFDGPGLTQNEADRDLDSPSAHKRFSELVNLGIARKRLGPGTVTPMIVTRTDPHSGMENEVYEALIGKMPVKPVSTKSPVTKIAAKPPPLTYVPEHPTKTEFQEASVSLWHLGHAILALISEMKDTESDLGRKLVLFFDERGIQLSDFSMAFKKVRRWVQGEGEGLTMPKAGGTNTAPTEAQQ